MGPLECARVKMCSFDGADMHARTRGQRTVYTSRWNGGVVQDDTMQAGIRLDARELDDPSCSSVGAML